MNKKKTSVTFNIWRYLINSWTIVFFLIIIYDFLTNNSAINLLNIVAMIYIGVLTVYVSDKEFERWYNNHHRQHPGEIFVIIWTILIISLVVIDYALQMSYHLPAAVVSSYIAVLTLLAITRKSKQIYQVHRHKK